MVNEYSWCLCVQNMINKCNEWKTETNYETKISRMNVELSETKF